MDAAACEDSDCMRDEVSRRACSPMSLVSISLGMISFS